jgi:hypothetical protein
MGAFVPLPTSDNVEGVSFDGIAGFYETKKASKVGSQMGLVTRRFADLTGLILFLLDRVEESRLTSCLLHFPYVQLLPKETLTPLHYSRDEILLLKSTPLFGHAAESRSNGRKSCIKAVRWILASLKEGQSDAPWEASLSDLLALPPDFLERFKTEEVFDLNREIEEWGDDEQQWQVLREWRWAETAYGR